MMIYVLLNPLKNSYGWQRQMKAVRRYEILEIRSLGFTATNDIFAENAWYFRNALVRANYTNLQKGIHETTEYLEAFLRNLLLNEKNELHNRNLHISGILNEEKVDINLVQADIIEPVSGYGKGKYKFKK